MQRGTKKALNTISAEMQKMSLAFQRIYQFLEEQKQLLLDQWKSLHTTVKEQEVRTATISEEISCLDSLITTAEERGPTVELEFLQVMQTASMRQTKCQELDGLLPEVEKGLAYQTRKNEVVTRTLGEFEATLSSELREILVSFQQMMGEKTKSGANKRKLKDRTADDAFDCSPESGMCFSSSQQPDKRAPAGDTKKKKSSQCPLF